MENLLTFPQTLYKPLLLYIQSLLQEFDKIPQERREVLQNLASVIRQELQDSGQVKLIFICTHNSRRSHIAQILAQTAAYYYAIKGIYTYSGGTEATTFNPRAVRAMQQAGFVIETTGDEPNPVYLVKFADKQKSIKAFSKIYDAPENPSTSFIAIMTCSHADENCPIIPGANLRVAVHYNDPKDFDGTSQESAAYNERTREIGREMFYLFNCIAYNHQ